ncbi:MAG: hypothetical protein O3B73_17760, partial [bacterium]|nr:hypothetical protein [bacterium]
SFRTPSIVPILGKACDGCLAWTFAGAAGVLDVISSCPPNPLNVDMADVALLIFMTNLAFQDQ